MELDWSCVAARGWQNLQNVPEMDPQRESVNAPPQTTWPRTVEGELRELEMNWGQAALIAKDRLEWNTLAVAALYVSLGTHKGSTT